MPEIVVVAAVTAAEGKEEELESMMRALIEPTHAEKGCIAYALHRDVRDPRVRMFVERWESLEDLERHLATDHLRAYQAAVPSVAAGPAQVYVAEAIPGGDPAKGTLAGS